MFLAEDDRRGLRLLDFVEEEIEPTWSIHHKLQVGQILGDVVLAINLHDRLDQPFAQRLERLHGFGVTLGVIDLSKRLLHLVLRGR